MKISLLEAVPEEAELLTQIIVDAFAEEVRVNRHAPPGYDSVSRRREAMAHGVRFFKIMLDQEPVGVISGSMRGPDCRIGVAAVRLPLQGRGIGSEALLQAEKMFPRVKRFFLETPALSLRNQHVYTKLGYRKFAESVEDPASGFRLFHMEKVI